MRRVAPLIAVWKWSDSVLSHCSCHNATAQETRSTPTGPHSPMPNWKESQWIWCFIFHFSRIYNCNSVMDAVLQWIGKGGAFSGGGRWKMQEDPFAKWRLNSEDLSRGVFVLHRRSVDLATSVLIMLSRCFMTWPRMTWQMPHGWSAEGPLKLWMY